jgi:hypothetical protein
MNPTLPTETEAATLTPGSDGTLEVHFKPGVRLTVPRIQEVLDARQRICGSGRYRVLVTLPPDVDLDMDVLSLDHYDRRDMHLCTYAVAWDAGSLMNEKLVEIFYRYFPQQFPVRAFTSAQEAREWLARQHAN